VSIEAEFNLSQWICKRYFYLEGTAADAVELTMCISRPVCDEQNPAFFSCEYELVGSKRRKLGKAFGVDGVDALLNAMAMAGSWVVGLNEAEYAGGLRWQGGNGDLGLITVEALSRLKKENP
jgi:hypothetical protein